MKFWVGLAVGLFIGGGTGALTRAWAWVIVTFTGISHALFQIGH
jgi:hypothetical protein